MCSKFKLEILRGKDHSEDLEVNGGQYEKCLIGVRMKDVDWTFLVQGRNHWWDFVSTVWTLGFRKRKGIL